MAVMLTMTWTPVSFGAVSPEEAAQLGKTLTLTGAEMAGNKEGTIPPYTGGLTKAPPNYKPGSGRYPDPFAAEKPLFSINSQNMVRYADKLTDGIKALMHKYPTFRIDVYKTHRTAAFPEYVIKNTANNAVKATTYHGGLSVKDARAGFPFPIPKTGYEAMWNHLLRYGGRAIDAQQYLYMVDRGRMIQTSEMVIHEECPYYAEDATRSDANLYWKYRGVMVGPPRMAGQAYLIFDPINMYEKPRIAYQYLPGQRRVKLAPELGFDTPDFAMSGVATFDESYCFNGSMERYDMKLIGKKEMYIPYNCYRAIFAEKLEDLLGMKHWNCDTVRWELHRVWVVEATLKPGKRHIYPKRRLYIDEDNWVAVLSETYDSKGLLFTVPWTGTAQIYDGCFTEAHFHGNFDLLADRYMAAGWLGLERGYIRTADLLPERQFTPQSLAAGGIR